MLAGDVQRLARHWMRARRVLEEALLRFFKDDSPMIAASIAYYCLLSVFPLLLLLLALGGLFIRQYDLSGEIAIVLQRYLPIKANFIMINLVQIEKAFGRVGIISMLILLWSSSGVFHPLEKALNRAWEIEERRTWWQRQLLALELAILLGLLVFLTVGLAGAHAYLHDRMLTWAALHAAPALTDFVFHASFTAITFAVTLAVFLLLFQRLPNRTLKFREVMPSALLTALFWEGARSLFTILLPFFNYRHVYGSIGAMVALMTWLYISSAVMLFGAHVSHGLYRTLESPLFAAEGPLPSSVHSAADVR